MYIRFVNKIFAIFFLCLNPFNSLAIDNSLSISKGQPTSEQNKSISVQDLIYQQSITNILSSEVSFGLMGRVGNIQVGSEQGTRLGIGSYTLINLYPVTISIPMSILMLDKSGYGINEKATKNYGGKLQFTYGMEVGYSINHNWEVFYRFEHMSNANRYEYNPGLDSHNLGIKVSF